MATLNLKVTGMKCGGCENAVQDAAKSVGGVSAATASHKEGTVAVEYDPAQTDEAAIRQAIQSKGYPVG